MANPVRSESRASEWKGMAESALSDQAPLSIRSPDIKLGFDNANLIFF